MRYKWFREDAVALATPINGPSKQSRCAPLPYKHITPYCYPLWSTARLIGKCNNSILVQDSDASRHSIVSQFNIVRTNLIDNETTPLQVGNGNFAYNVDTTGMQACHLDFQNYHVIDLKRRHTCLSIHYLAGPGTMTHFLRTGMEYSVALFCCR